MVALSVMTSAPLIEPLEPSAGRKLTFTVQVAPAARMRLAAQGLVPPPT